MLENAEQIRKLRAKKQEASEKQKLIDKNEEAISAGLSEAASKYPEITGKSFEESLSMLRSAETDYKIGADKLETAGRNLQKFLNESEIPQELFTERNRLALQH